MVEMKLLKMAYWQISGRDEGGKIIPIQSVDEIIDKTQEGFLNLIRFFEQKETAYVACPDLSIKPKYNDYEHLERLAEWSTLEDEDTDE